MPPCNLSRKGIGSQTAEAAFETDRWEKVENGVFDYRGLLIKGDAHEVRDPTVGENAMRLLKEKEPGGPFGEHPIVTSIIPKKRYKWGPWSKLTNQSS